MQRRSRMAKNTFFGDRPREIRLNLIFISRRKIIGLTAPVVSDRRLEEMSANLYQISAGVFARANHIVNAILRFLAAIFPTLPEPRW